MKQPLTPASRTLSPLRGARALEGLLPARRGEGGRRPDEGTVRITIILLLVFACASPRSGTTALPGHGAITLNITPNPIVAHAVSGSTFDFPFDLIVRETGGHPLNVRDVAADVYAMGGIPVGNETYDAAKIQSLGFPTTVPANGELRYHLDPRRTVTDPSFFSSVTADVRVDASDDTGTATSAHVVVTITKG